MKGTLEKALTQWDTGQYITLDEECTWVDYTIAGLPGCVRVPVESSVSGEGDDAVYTYRARIPNLVLTYSGALTIMLVEEDDAGHRTEARQVEFITKREKPTGYVYTDDDYITWASMQSRLHEALLQDIDDACEGANASWEEAQMECEDMLAKMKTMQDMLKEKLQLVRAALLDDDTDTACNRLDELILGLGELG